jgi:hypothetical protein
MKMMKEKKIRKEHQQQSRIAWKELYYMYKDDIHKVNLHRGQDNFFDILCLPELPEKRNRSCARTTNLYHTVHTKYELRTNMNKSSENQAITTNSYEQLHIHKNLINDLKLERFNQVWVSDITCLRTGSKFACLSLIINEYLSKVSGCYLSENLSMAGRRNALQKGISTCINPEKIIYYSSDTETLISMTEENCCYGKGIRRPYWALKFKTPEEVHSAAA